MTIKEIIEVLSQYEEDQDVCGRINDDGRAILDPVVFECPITGNTFMILVVDNEARSDQSASFPKAIIE